jgi:hypothetical protein
MSRLCDLIKIINCSSSFKFKRTSLPPSHRSHEPYATLMDAKSALFFNRIDIAPLYPFRTQDLITTETCHGVKMPSIKEMASFTGVNKFSFLSMIHALIRAFPSSPKSHNAPPCVYAVIIIAVHF